MRHVVFVFALCGAACQTNTFETATRAPAQHQARVPPLNTAGLSPRHVEIINRAHARDASPTSKPEHVSLERIAAEGGGAQVWYQDGVVQKVVVEKRGETFDSATSIDFESGRPFYARRFVVFDPAKFAQEGTPEYLEAAEGRTLEVAHYFWNGDKIEVMTAKLKGANPASYDGGSLVETSVGPVTSAPKDSEIGVQLREAIGQDLKAIEPILNPKDSP
ncbi:MAG: hypothetical protein R3E66_23730 [bacterium]